MIDVTAELLAILRMRTCSLRNRLRGFRKDAIAKTFVVIFGLTTIVGLGFWVSYKSFQFIEEIPAFGIGLNAKLVGLLFFALLVLVILSTVIVAFTTLFIARETGYFFQHPLAPQTIFVAKLTEAVAFSSWATLFLCYPVLISFGVLRKAAPVYYLEAALVLLSFLLFAGLAGATVAVALAPIVRRLNRRQLVAGGLLVVGLLSWLFLRSFRIWDMDGENNLLVLDRFASNLPLLQSPYFPGHWASNAVLAAAAANHSEVLFQLGTLLANTLVLVPFLAWYGERHYGGAYLAARDPRPLAAVRNGAGERRRRLLPRNPVTALVLKDLRVFVRDPAQLSQSVLFVVLMVIYSLSLVRMPDFLTSGRLAELLYFANLGAVCAILSSFTSRFLFPLISLEGRAFWIVGLAPLPRSRLVYQKALFGLGVTLVLGVFTTLFSNLALGYPLHLVIGALYTIILAGICLSALATGLGAAYPSFEEDNPARIAVGLGGTLNFFASAMAVACLILVQASPYLFEFGRLPRHARILAAHVVALVFTVVLARVCLRIGVRALERSEF